MFIKVTVTNWYVGYDETSYYEVKDANEAEECVECDRGNYSWADPDPQFCNVDDEDEVEAYYDGIEAWWVEIDEEEYRENT